MTEQANYTHLTYSQWSEQYKPLRNEHEDYIEIEFDETEKLNKLMKENRLWTELDGDDCICITSGFHFVNRLRYFATEKPYDPNIFVDVWDEEDLNDNEFIENE